MTAMELQILLEWMVEVAHSFMAPAVGGSGATVAVYLIIKQILKWVDARRQQAQASFDALEERVRSLEHDTVTHTECNAYREALDTKVNSSNQAIEWIRENLIASNERMEVWMTDMAKSINQVRVDIAVLVASKKSSEDDEIERG